MPCSPGRHPNHRHRNLVADDAFRLLGRNPIADPVGFLLADSKHA